jgi:hypothetical protein
MVEFDAYAAKWHEKHEVRALRRRVTELEAQVEDLLAEITILEDAAIHRYVGEVGGEG